MIMILSHGGDERRTSVRDTWLQGQNERVKWVFLIGNIDEYEYREKVLEEQRVYGDLLIMNDVEDTYDMLSKKVVRGLQEIYHRYQFHFLLKTDTDVFLVVPRLLEFLQPYSPNKTYIGWKRSFQLQPKEKDYPEHMREITYMLGGGYLLSRDLVEYFALSQHLMSLWYSEDVTIGIHLSNLAVNYVAVPGRLFSTGSGTACGCTSSLIINHKCAISDIYYMYYSYNHSNNMCEYLSNSTYKKEIAEQYQIPAEKELEFHWKKRFLSFMR